MMLLHLSAIWWQGLESAFKIELKRSSHALVTESVKYGNKPLASTGPNAGAIALLKRLCKSPVGLVDELEVENNEL